MPLDDAALEALGAQAFEQQVAPGAQPAPQATAPAETKAPEPELPVEPAAEPVEQPAPEPAAEAATPEGEQSPEPEAVAASDDEGPPEKIELPWHKHLPEASREITDEEEAKQQQALDELLKLDESPERNEKIWNAVRNTKRGRHFYDEARAIRDWRAEVGGLPTPDTIQKLTEARDTLGWMAEHLDNGTPQDREKFFRYWFADQDGRPREGAAQALRQLPEVAYRLDPQLYEGLERQFVQNRVDYYYAKAGKMPDGDQKEKLLALAENLEYEITGKYRGMNGHQNGAAAPPHVNGSAQPNGLDPQTAEYIRSLEGRVRDYEGQQSQGRESTLKTQIDEKLGTLVEQTVFGKWKPQEFVKDSVKDRLIGQLRQSVDGDSRFMSSFDLDRRNAFRSGDPQAVASLVERYVQRAGAALEAKWPEISKGLRKANADTQQRSEQDQQRQKLAAAQGMTAPGAGGKPVPAVAAQPLKRGASEDLDDFATRVAQQQIERTQLAAAST